MFSSSSRWRLVVAAGDDVMLRLPLAEGNYLLGPGAEDELRLLDVRGEIDVASDGVRLSLDNQVTELSIKSAAVGKFTLRAERTQHASGRTQSMPGTGAHETQPLLVTPPKGMGSTVRFARGELRVGYDESCDVRVRSEFVSQFHCVLLFKKNQVFVRDLGSKNGTYLNEVKIVEAELSAPATLRVGDVSLKIEALSTDDNELSSYIIGRSFNMQALGAQISRFAQSRAPVMILGESGTGKELVARAVHELSPRKNKPFVVINCGALASNLIESELFGHMKGAFTGASERRAGAFASAHDGTLFLDEIGELPLSLQPTLLRAIETGRIKAVGDDAERAVDVRLVVATHRDLGVMQRRGQFREDLYHRVSVLVLDVPPLRERGDDIILIAEHFLSELAPEGRVFRLGPDAVTKLRTHAFPGNVRELRNALTRAIVLARGEVISAEDLSLVTNEDIKPRQMNISSGERDMIVSALRESRGSRLTAARALGIARSSLYRKMEQHGIGDDEIFPRR